MTLDLVDVAYEDAGRDVRPSCGGNHAIKCFEVDLRIQLSGTTERRGEIAGADEEYVEARRCRDPRNVRERRGRFNLNDAKQYIIHVARGPGVASEVSGAVVRRDTAIPLRRIPQVVDGISDFIGRVESRKHDARGTEIECVTDADTLRRLDAHQNRNVVRRSREELSDESFLATGTVFEVDQQPVKATQRAHFGDEGRSEIEKRAKRHIAVAHTLLESRHDETLCDQHTVRRKFFMG